MRGVGVFLDFIPATSMEPIRRGIADIGVVKSNQAVVFDNAVFLRGFLVDGKPDAASKMFRDGLKICPLARTGDSPAMEFVSGSNKVFNTVDANTFAFCERDELLVNADSSVDLCFGPEAPRGKERNWTQTIAGKGWFALLGLYGPLEPWFARTWCPGEIEPVK